MRKMIQTMTQRRIKTQQSASSSEAGCMWNVGREWSKTWGLATVYNIVFSLEERFDASECWILPSAADEDRVTNSLCSLYLRQVGR